jgi:hypothetical protein
MRKAKTLSFITTMTSSAKRSFQFILKKSHLNSMLASEKQLLQVDGYQLSVYKIEHFYSMPPRTSQGKIYCILYALCRSLLPGLKRKKPVQADRLFNLLQAKKISSFFR